MENKTSTSKKNSWLEIAGSIAVIALIMMVSFM